jgi:hypothetical protein
MATIDTHAIIKELIASGTPEKQAEVLVSRFVVKEELSSVEKDHSRLATKLDIMGLESRINSLDTNIKWIIALTLAAVGMLIKSTFF